MPKIFLTGSESTRGYLTGSGFLNNPVRTIIRDLDIQTGTYPTVHRMNRKDDTGILSNIVFDDTKTIKFGNAINDDFTIEEDNVFSRQVNSSLWEVSTTDVLVKKEFDPASDLELTTGAVVLGGIGDSDGRWLKTKNKIANPTLIFSVLQGPYNNTGALANFKLNLGQGQITDTFKIQASIDGNNWNYDIDINASNLGTTYDEYINLDSGVLQPTPIFTFFNGLTGEQQNTSGQQKKAVLNIKLDIQDFSKAGLKEPFYLRFIQPSISDNNVAVWAIGHVNIISREDQVTYPHLGVNSHATNFQLTQSIATPNYVGNLIASGSSISNISDIKRLPFSDQAASPFNEESVIDFTNDGFYTVGTKEDTTPGFSSGLLSKTKFEVDLSPNQTIELGYTKPLASTSDDGQQLMCYWNPEEKKWEKIGQPYSTLNVRGVSGDTHKHVVGILTSSCVGFGPFERFVDGLDNVGINNWTQLVDEHQIQAYNKPTTTFNFPYGPQYHATSSQYIKARDLGITKPFLFEKSVIEFNASFEKDISSNSTNHTLGSTQARIKGDFAYGDNESQYGDFGSAPSTSGAIFKGITFITPTFFMLRQGKNTYNIDRFYSAGTGDGVRNYNYSLSVPREQKIISGSSQSVHVNTSRDLVTYSQIRIIHTGSYNGGGVATGLSVPLSSLNEVYDLDAPSLIVTASASDILEETQLNLTSSFKIENSVKNACRYGNSTSIKFSITNPDGTPEDHILISKDYTTRGFSPLESSRSVVNGYASSIIDKNATVATLGSANGDPLTIVSANKLNTINVASPYIIFPDDELIFGWQYPLFSRYENSRPTSTSVGRFKMNLFGDSKLTLYGSQIKDGKEFHEGLNQNLTSNVVHEVIGSDPVIDQWQIETRGELTGSFEETVPFNIKYPIAIHGDAIFDPTEVKKGFDYAEWQVLGLLPASRVSETKTTGSPASSKKPYNTNYSILNPPTIPVQWSFNRPGIIRAKRVYDTKRVYSDARLLGLSGINVSGTGGNTIPDVEIGDYGSMQSFTNDEETADRSTRKSGFPKYYYNRNHYGYLSDNMRQGLDSKFERVIERSGQTITEAAVRIKFVEDDYDEENLNFRKFSLIKASDVDGTSQESFQSSNLSLFATSSLPFFDDNVARNRTYGIDTVEVT